MSARAKSPFITSPVIDPPWQPCWNQIPINHQENADALPRSQRRHAALLAGSGRGAPPMLFLDSLGCGSGAVMAVQISPPATMITILSPTMSPR